MVGKDHASQGSIGMGERGLAWYTMFMDGQGRRDGATMGISGISSVVCRKPQEILLGQSRTGMGAWSGI